MGWNKNDTIEIRRTCWKSNFYKGQVQNNDDEENVYSYSMMTDKSEKPVL